MAMIAFTVIFDRPISNSVGKHTRVAVTLANHSAEIGIDANSFADPPSRADFKAAVETLLRAAFWAKTGTPTQRVNAMEAGIDKLAFKNYATDTLVNP